MKTNRKIYFSNAFINCFVTTVRDDTKIKPRFVYKALTNEDITLKCYSSHSVTWKYGHPVEYSKKISEEKKLRLNPIKLEQSGKYNCLGYNLQRPFLAIVNVIVYGMLHVIPSY